MALMAGRLIVGGIAALWGGIAEARAQVMQDPASGLGVNPPAGYVAQPTPARGRYTANFEIKRTRDYSTVCKIGFQPAAQNRQLTQAQINELVSSRERKAAIEASLGSLYQVTTVELIEHAGVWGSAVVAMLKPLPESPVPAGDMIKQFYLMETPSGRTTIVCAAEQQTFKQRKHDFESVLRGVSLPR